MQIVLILESKAASGGGCELIVRLSQMTCSFEYLIRRVYHWRALEYIWVRAKFDTCTAAAIHV